MIRSALILTLLLFLVLGGVLYLLFSLLPNFRPSRRKVQDDLQRMKEELKPLTEGLVPITKEEMDLFSKAQMKQVVHKNMLYKARGVYTSIYHEPLIAYSFKKYFSSELDAILYVRSADHEFAYRFKKGAIQVIMDQKVVGTLRQNGVLYGGQNNRMIARINRNTTEQLIPIIVGEREVGNVLPLQALPSQTDQNLNNRAFDFVKADLTPQEKEIFLSLGLLEVVSQQLDLK